MQLLLKRLHPEVKMPTRAYPTSVGFDIHAFLFTEEGRPNSVLIPPGNVRPIKTGLAFGGFTSNANYESAFATVCSRSGLAAEGIFVANAPGIIDPEYRGEILVLLFNGSNGSHYVRHGDRVAQLVVNTLRSTVITEANFLTETERGDRGFGSTGR